MQKILIVKQPACSNVFLVEDGNGKRLLQCSYDRCFAFAQGYAAASGLSRYEIPAKAGDCSPIVQRWAKSPEAAA